ncbi:MAG: GDSL-type esterase/lipase family protein [Sumerlaeia bacterium]
MNHTFSQLRLIIPVVVIACISLSLLFAQSFSGFSVTGKPGTAPPSYTPQEIQDRVALARERWGAVYAERMELFMKETPQESFGGTVFLGDSITHVFELDIIFPDSTFINRGISGDTVQGLTDRLDVSVAALKPKAIYVLIGTNNLWQDSSEPFIEGLMQDYAKLFTAIKSQAPEAAVTIQAVLPTRDAWLFRNDLITAVNARLQPLALQHGFAWLDLSTPFQNKDNHLRAELTFDGLHLNSDGYILWAQLLQPEADIVTFYQNIAPQWLAFNRRDFPISLVNPPQMPQPADPALLPELVLYNNEYPHPTTRSPHGILEAVIQNNTVVGIANQESVIPENGYVLSAYGRGFIWVYVNLKPGVELILADQVVSLLPIPVEEQTTAQQITQLMVLCLDHLQNPALSQNHAMVREILRVLIELKQNPTAADETTLLALQEQLDKIPGQNPP